MSRTLHLVEQLVARARASVTPADAGCQDIIARGWHRWASNAKPCPSARRTFAGHQPVGPSGRPAAGRRHAANQKLLVFAGHTDVVPTGPLAQWTATRSPPPTATAASTAAAPAT
jgi:succinyl-diaminopimelate desuccinylase